MKRCIMTLVCGIVFAAEQTRAAESATITNRTVVLDSTYERVNTNWVGHAISEVVGKAHPVTVVVLKNLTQAMPQMHADRMRLILQSNQVIQTKPAEHTDNVWFDCLVIMDDGRIIRMERSHDWGRLSTVDGTVYFSISDKDLMKNRPNQPSEATR